MAKKKSDAEEAPKRKFDAEEAPKKKFDEAEAPKKKFDSEEAPKKKHHAEHRDTIAVKILPLLGFVLFAEALYSMAFSTDQITLYTASRVIRAVIGILLATKSLGKRYYGVAAAYLILEAIGSFLISPDVAEKYFQIEYAVRIAAGLLLYYYSRRK
ncbi:hypothetical protein AUJ14_04285 [Candidatus Micrarchaeota archaeon CG1_02_55_22]|nr:MAG: hypothetical protein AUJ14_04285 [Candidatus Micrarchaeota archaeon CG1_02_55_22]